jgi:hypothetical protein
MSNPLVDMDKPDVIPTHAGYRWPIWLICTCRFGWDPTLRCCWRWPT